MTVALYCRVSTDEQAKEGFSLEAQKDILLAYCKIHGWTDHKFYIDDGYTGSTIDRPALKRVIYHAQQKRISDIVVMKLDRLSRSQKDTLFLIEDVFVANGIGFHSTRETLDTTTPVGKLMIGILSSFAQFERETLIERTTMGRRKRVSTGLWHGGRIPFGYTWDKESQRLIVNVEQAQLIREVYRRFMNGHSYSSIADWLSERTTAIVLDHGIIRDMLRRIVYTGRMNNAGEIVDGHHDAIIDVDTWDKVQDEIDKRREGRTPIGSYLLTGLCECGVCGGPIIHITMNTHGHRYEYYVCKKQHVRPRERKGEICSLGYKRKEVIEKFVVEELKSRSLDPEKVKRGIAKIHEPATPNDDVISAITSRIDEIESELDRWYEAFGSGRLKLTSQVEGRIGELEEEKKSLQLRLDDLEVIPKPDRTPEYLESLQLISQAWDYMTFEEQQSVLRETVLRIILHPGNKNPELIPNV